MSAQGDGVAGMAEYDVAHIDLDQYRQLRALVLEGRAKARIIVETLNLPLIVGAQEARSPVANDLVG